MKIATVTWLTYNNYGTQLQAYALQKFLTINGHENEILDDNDILQEQWRAKGNSSHHVTSSKEACILRLVKKPFRYIKWQIWKQRVKPYTESQRKINDFKRECLVVNTKVNARNLACLNNRYDLFICGSDQIWSPLDLNLNGYYYLNFVSKKKIAYAPSLGMKEIPEKKTKLIQNWLKSFDSISVREKQNVEQISAIYGNKVFFVSDPTLLLNTEQWTSFCKDGMKIRKKYILCYFLEDKNWYFEYAMQTAKKYDLSLVLIPNRAEHTRRRICIRKSVSPIDFVSLFMNASIVITDSYHGSIFSVLFQKDFYYLKRFNEEITESQNVRIASLFETLGLYDRIIEEGKTTSGAHNIIDYESVGKKLEAFRAQSSAYLLKNLNTNKKESVCL